MTSVGNLDPFIPFMPKVNMEKVNDNDPDTNLKQTPST